MIHLNRPFMIKQPNRPVGLPINPSFSPSNSTYLGQVFWFHLEMWAKLVIIIVVVISDSTVTWIFSTFHSATASLSLPNIPEKGTKKQTIRTVKERPQYYA